MKRIKYIATLLVALTVLAALPATGTQESQEEGLTVVKLGLVGSIGEEVWAPAKASLREQGIDLQYVQFSDYVTPNNALSSGEIDLNAFQHQLYLQNEINSYGYDLTIIGNTFIIPLNLYSEKVKSVDEIKDGDIIAIPNDVTNGGRALKVIADAGLIEIDPSVGFSPTLQDITKYNKKIVIKELAANTIPSVLPDVTAGIVNGGYALDFGLDPDLAIFKDTSLGFRDYWNIIVARTSDLEDPEKRALYRKVVKAYQTQETEDIFNDVFNGYFIKQGWDEDLI